ncbi:MAG: class I SAM-dependent methyltransferase [Deltaproteobacteria bacterium]
MTATKDNGLMKRAARMYWSFLWKRAAVKAFVYDFRLGIRTREEEPRRRDIYVGEKDTSVNKDMLAYEGMFYGTLKRMVARIEPGPDDVFIDLGCGKGRVVFVMAQQRLRKVIGVELDNSLVSAARRNYATLRKARTPVEIVHADAAEYRFTDENIIFMYNPFGPKTMEKVLANLKSSLETNPRPIRVLYYNPHQKAVLDSQDWLRLDSGSPKDKAVFYSNAPSIARS